MDRNSRASSMRRLASGTFGALAIIALVAAPTMAHERTGVLGESRHVLLVAELSGADASEQADLEALLEAADGLQAQAGTSDVLGTDVSATDGAGDPAATDQPDATAGAQTGADSAGDTQGSAGAGQAGGTDTHEGDAPEATEGPDQGVSPDAANGGTGGATDGSPDATNGPDGGSGGN